MGLIDEVNEMRTYPAGWDSYDAAPISAIAADEVVAFLQRIGDEVEEPFVAPLHDGGIQVEWERGDDYLEFVVEPSGRVLGWFTDDVESDAQPIGWVVRGALDTGGRA